MEKNNQAEPIEFKKGMLLRNPRGTLFRVAGFYDADIVIMEDNPNGDFCNLVTDEQLEEDIKNNGWSIVQQHTII